MRCKKCSFSSQGAGRQRKRRRRQEGLAVLWAASQRQARIFKKKKKIPAGSHGGPLKFIATNFRPLHWAAGRPPAQLVKVSSASAAMEERKNRKTPSQMLQHQIRKHRPASHQVSASSLAYAAE